MATHATATAWYVARTQLQREAVAAFHLKRQNYPIIWLRYPTQVRHARQTKQVLKSYLPGYVFLATSEDQDLGPARRTPGIITIVQAAQKPLQVPEDVIEELRARGDQDGIMAPLLAPTRPLLAPGQAVTIGSGPFAGLAATILLDDGAKIRLTLKWLGRAVELNIEPNALTVLSPELRSAPNP